MSHPGDYCSENCVCDLPCDLAALQASHQHAALLRQLEATDGLPAAPRREWDHGPIAEAVDDWKARGVAMTTSELRARVSAGLPSIDMVDLVARNVAAVAALGDLTDEVRVVDPLTGGEKGQKLARFDLLPADALHATAEHFGRGARKYEDRNWEKGYAWSLSFGAMMRHLWAWWGGEEIDAETGSHHLAAATFHSLALHAFVLRGIGTDDRALRSTPALDLGA